MYNNKNRTLRERIRDCSDLLRLDDCSIRQPLVSRSGAIITPELNEVAILKGPYSKEQEEFQPEQESFAYHGAGRTKDMFRHLVERVNISCSDDMYDQLSETGGYPLIVSEYQAVSGKP
eukprot:GHVO01056743.1.p1 GENE.GHVO01056743.1~~GHVO01056743.1.p1  ORF type:complete len:140 (-),score=6.39 GHVO01056743.1:217-573(-)